MSTNQYYCNVKDNEFIQKEGHFFKAGAFEITINSTLYNVTFEPLNHTTVYKIQKNSNTLAELIHPDYAPDCTFETLNTKLQNTDMKSLFFALCKHNICIHKDYIKFIDENPNFKVSYEIKQKSVIS
jgi:hypothetical protein